MRVVFKTTNHKKFSTNINKGTIIAEDWGNDGHWDHIGFVTAVDNHIGNYGYRDYKVAQHTNNYHLQTNSGHGAEVVGAVLSADEASAQVAELLKHR